MTNLNNSSQGSFPLFTNERDCRKYLERLRWPNGFVCPRCNSTDAYELKSRNAYQCRACRKQTSVTSGTFFHGVKRLSNWFSVAGAMQPGESASSLSEKLDVCYSSVWLIVQRFRCLIGSQIPSDFEEVDETQFQTLLFRRSSEPLAEEQSTDTASAEPAPPASAKVSALLKFIAEKFHGISRKFLTNYAAAFWYALDTITWSFLSLIRLAIKTSAITREMVLNFCSPRLIKIPHVAAGSERQSESSTGPGKPKGLR